MCLGKKALGCFSPLEMTFTRAAYVNTDPYCAACLARREFAEDEERQQNGVFAYLD